MDKQQLIDGAIRSMAEMSEDTASNEIFRLLSDLAYEQEQYNKLIAEKEEKLRSIRESLWAYKLPDPITKESLGI